MSEDAKAPVSVVRTGRVEHVLRLDADEPKDPWEREGANTLVRFHAEKAVREYAAAKKWGAIRFRHVGELVREVPVALWSVTVRDLIAEAVVLARLDVAAVYTVTQNGVPVAEPRPVVLTAKRKALPRVAQNVAQTTPRQAEAAAMLRELADFFRSPSRLGTPLADLDTGAMREELASGRKLDSVREDLAGKLGSTGETFTRAVRRAKAAPKKPRR